MKFQEVARDEELDDVVVKLVVIELDDDDKLEDEELDDDEELKDEEKLHDDEELHEEDYTYRVTPSNFGR